MKKLMLKRILSTTLALCLAFLCAAVYAEESDITGVWYIMSMLTADSELDAAKMGISGSLEIKKDGTVVLTLDGTGEVTEGTWTKGADGEITVSLKGLDGQGSIDEEGCLSVRDAEGGIRFSRESQETFTPPDTTSAGRISDFNGRYRLHYVYIYGKLMAADRFMEDPEMAGAMGIADDWIEVTDGAVDLFGTGKVPFDFTEGMLAIRRGEKFDRALLLTEDGGVAFMMYGVIFYFRPEN